MRATSSTNISRYLSLSYHYHHSHFMFDTVRIAWPHHLFRKAVPPAGWKTTSFTHTIPADSGGAETRHTAKHHHIATGLVASGTPGLVKRVQFSLPHVLFGSNAKLIRSQAQTDEALLIAADILKQIGIPLGNIERFTRVDLVWQFLLDPRLVIQAHRHARHPRIRANAGHYENQSIYWHGKNLRIRMYDKTLEQTREPGDVTRIEFELHGRLLHDMLAPAGAPVMRLDFNRAYVAYRELMLGFAPFDVPVISDIAELLAVAAAANCRYRGLSMFEIWASGKNPEHVRRVQKQLAALRPRFFNINWEELLPADRPPEAVEPDMTNLEAAV